MDLSDVLAISDAVYCPETQSVEPVGFERKRTDRIEGGGVQTRVFADQRALKLVSIEWKLACSGGWSKPRLLIEMSVVGRGPSGPM